jgi:hypothetical protein
LMQSSQMASRTTLALLLLGATAVSPALVLRAPSLRSLSRHAVLRGYPRLASSSEEEDLSGNGGCLMVRMEPPLPGGETASERTFAQIRFRATLPDGTPLSDVGAPDGQILELRVGMEPSEAVLGWELALPRMRTGEKVRLVCAPEYAFGADGAPPLIPPNATVHFELELLGVRDVLSSNNTETVDFLHKYEHIIANEEGVPMAEKEAAAKIANVEGGGSLAGEDDLPRGSAGSGSNNVAGLGGSSSGRGDGSPPPPLPGQRTWVPSATRIEAEHADGYTWRETDHEIELRIPLPPEASGPSDVEVEIRASSICVRVLGAEVMAGELVGKTVADESTWSYVRPDNEESGERAVLQVDLMKKTPSVGDASLWGYILASERDEANEDE